MYEIHGNCFTWQCSKPCCEETWRAPDDFKFQINEETMRAAKNNKRHHSLLSDENTSQSDEDKLRDCFKSNHPVCPKCGEKARPNILMFSGMNFIEICCVSN